MCTRSGSLSRLSAHRSRSHGRRTAPYRPRNAPVSIASDVRCSTARDRRRPHRLRDLGARRGRPARAAPGRRGDADEVARARRLADERRARPRQAGRRAAARRRGSGSSTRSTASPPRHVERVEIAGPGFVNFFLAPTWLHDVLTAVVTDGDDVRSRRRLRRRAHQPRVRVGEPDGPAARGRRPVGRGRRRDREPPRRAGRGRAPRVLPERRGRRSSTRSPRRSWRATAGREPPGGRLPGRVPGRPRRRDARRARRRRVTRRRRANGVSPHVVARAPRRPRAHRRALRHVVLGAHAARARRRRPRCSTTCAPVGTPTSRTAPSGSRPRRSATSATGCSCARNGSTTYLANDFAYHRDKFARGWDHLIDIWGADHHGQVKSLQIGMRVARVRHRGGAGARDHPRPARHGSSVAARSCGSRSAPAT